MLPLLLAKFGSKLWMGVGVLVLLGSAYGYYRWSAAEMGRLRSDLILVQKQADDLVVAKRQLEQDVQAIKAAQDVVNVELSRSREAAAVLSRTMRASLGRLKAKAKSDPHAVEAQINNDQASTLRALEDITR